MKMRKGFYRITVQHLRRGELGWLFRQVKKYFGIKRSISRGDGKISTGPIIVHLFSTSRCDSRCIMCDLPNRLVGYEFTTADFKDMLSQFIELGVTGISLTGGEPTLRKDIHELMFLCRDAGLDTILVTNGLTLDRHIDKIIELNLNTVNVSLESADPAVHDRIRGIPGAFEKTTGNIKKLIQAIREKRAQTEVVISTVIGPDNLTREKINSLLEYVDSLGIGRVVFCPVHDFDCRRKTVGIGNMDLDYDLSKHLLTHPRRSIIDNSDLYLGQLNEVINTRHPPSGCVAGYTTLFIDWAMNVYPCKAYLEMETPLFNLKESNRDLKDIWYSETFDEFRRFCSTCSRCFLSVNREFDGVFH